MLDCLNTPWRIQAGSSFLKLSYTSAMKLWKIFWTCGIFLFLASCGANSTSQNQAPTPTRKIFPTITLPGSTNTPAISSTPLPTSTPTPTPYPIPTATIAYEALILPKGPDVIYTGINTEMKLFWQGDPGESYLVEWGTNGDLSQISAELSPNQELADLYNFTLNGLQPGTKYEYRILSGGKAAGGSFWTAPSSETENLSFTVYGDSQTNPGLHDQVAARIGQLVADDQAFQSFVLHTGDLANEGDMPESWDEELFNPQYQNIRYELANLPLIPTNGNHDGRGKLFLNYFPYPYVKGRYWSFDYGPAHVVILDQYYPFDEGTWENEWLVNDLKSSDRRWKFVVLHEPGWSAGGGHDDNTTVQQVLEPIFEKYGVTMVFTGHNHYYARAEKNGVIHLTLGTGGAQAYSPTTSHKYVQFTYNGLGFEKIQITGNKLEASFVETDGTEIDPIVLEK
jgi:hypothetical protein